MKRLVASALALTVYASASSAAERHFSGADVQRIVGLSSPALSPDGTRVALVVTRIDVDEDRYVRDIDLVDVRTKARRTLTYGHKGLSDPAWSPSGDRLAFVAEDGTGDDAKSQVFVMRLDGGDARPITKAPEGVEQFVWRPDGTSIAYVAEDRKPKPTGAAKYRDAFEVGNNPITATAAARPLHLWTFDLASAKATQRTFGTTSIAGGEAQGALSWSSDGTTIAFALAPNAVLNDADRARVSLLDTRTNAVRALTNHGRYESDPRFSPDGRQIAYVHSAGDNQITLANAYVTTPAGGEGRNVSERFDRAVHDYAWAPDGKALLYAVADGPQLRFVRAPLSGAATALELGDINPTSSLTNAVARDGGIAFIATSTRRPSELYYRAPGGGVPVALTDYNAAIAALPLGDSETVTYRAQNGMATEAILTKPADFDARRKYPLVLEIHGGPTSSSSRSFDRLAQLMAARGWLVLEPNYRGSDNHGLAFQSAVRYDPEDGPAQDILAAVNAVAARGVVDPKRLAVSGWSYGGIMTAWLVTHDHRWAAAVSGASVDDWRTDYSIADDLDADVALAHDSPWRPGQAPEWERISAVNYAANVTTPLLILSDTGDNRDPIATSYEFYHALKDNGKDVTFIAYPVAGHFPRDPDRSLDVYERWVEYIAKHF